MSRGWHRKIQVVIEGITSILLIILRLCSLCGDDFKASSAMMRFLLSAFARTVTKMSVSGRKQSDGEPAVLNVAVHL
jgi:hypothetical protein